MDVGVGLLDARNVRLEEPSEVLQHLEPIILKQGPSKVWIHPNCGLEFLPPDRAEQKVRLLKDIKTLING